MDRHVENLWWTLFKFLYYKLLILRVFFSKRKHTIFVKVSKKSFTMGRCGVVRLSVRPSVCVFASGVYCWEHLELRNLANVSLGTLPGGFFQKNFKNLKMGFLAIFFTFFLKNGGVFLWTHVQSWNCGEIMRGCLMKCIFFGRFSKISKLDFWRIFLWKSRERRDYNSGNLV